MIQKAAILALLLGALFWFYSRVDSPSPVPDLGRVSTTSDSTALTDVDAAAPDVSAAAPDVSVDDQTNYQSVEPPAVTQLDLQPGDVIYQRGDFVERRLVVTECYPETLSAYTDEGLVTMAVPRCEKELQYLHPYGDMDRDSLTKLAEYDGAAALILAEKLAVEKPDDSRVTRLFVHAFALSNEPQAFEALFDYAGGHGLVYTNGELDKARAANSYIWSQIGDRAGLRDSGDVDAYREALLEAGIDMDSLDQTVERIASLINSQSTKFNGESLL